MSEPRRCCDDDKPHYHGSRWVPGRTPEAARPLSAADTIDNLVRAVEGRCESVLCPSRHEGRGDDCVAYWKAATLDAARTPAPVPDALRALAAEWEAEADRRERESHTTTNAHAPATLLAAGILRTNAQQVRALAAGVQPVPSEHDADYRAMRDPIFTERVQPVPTEPERCHDEDCTFAAIPHQHNERSGGVYAVAAPVPTDTSGAAGSICECGLAKSYHGPNPPILADHEYRPRFVPTDTPWPDHADMSVDERR